MEESKLIRAKELDGGRIKELEKGKEERDTKMEKNKLHIVHIKQSAPVTQNAEAGCLNEPSS